MTPTTAIQRAEQWRKEGACGEAAKVAIALLNELERVQELYTSLLNAQKIEDFAHDLSKRNHVDLVVADALAGDRMALYAKTSTITAPFPGMDKPWTEKEISDFRKALEYQDEPEKK